MSQWKEGLAKAVQLGLLLSLGWVASYDVARTMQQKPISQENVDALQAKLVELREQRR